MENGKELDDILEDSTILDEFKCFLPGSVVITILNGFKSDIIIKNILDSIENKKVSYGIN